MKTVTPTLLLFLAACASSAPPAKESSAPPAPSAPAPTSAPTPEPSAAAPAPTPAAEPAPTPKADVPPMTKPKSEWSVDGTSLSEVDALALAGAFKKAKLTDSGSAGGSMGGGYESVGFPISKGKLKGRFYMVRPAKTPTPAETSLGDPKVAQGMLDKDKAYGVLDEAAALYFEIRIDEGGKAADAKKMLDAVIRRAKGK